MTFELKTLSPEAVPRALAELIRPPGNDDGLLRWNTCARLIMRDGRLVPAPSEERGEPLFLE